MFKVGDIVRAKVVVTECGDPNQADPDARWPSGALPDPGWIHAQPGDLGEVVHVEEDTYPTVRFKRVGTATIVHPDEVELVVDKPN